MMGLFQRLRNLLQRREATTVKMVSTHNTLALWGNDGYNNDIVRACVNAKALRISKLNLKHVQETTDDNGNKKLVINPWPYLRFLLEEPNRYMSLSAFLFKLSVFSDLTGNAFVLILRDVNGIPAEWFPVPYNYPPITDLAQPDGRNEDTSEEDAMRSRKLEETLANFKVQARVVNVTHGPAISRFEMELAAGIKVSKVAELEKDIAYGMEATSIRIEAPIPGKSLVGVEVPNRKVAKVTLREVLESNRMQDAEADCRDHG